MTVERSGRQMKSLFAAIAGLVLVVVAFAVARQQELMDPELARRIVAMALGLMLVVIGNALPKLVRPLSAHAHDPARVMAAERYAGRTFVAAGLVFAALWAFAPAAHVMRLSALVGLSAFGLVAVSRLRLTLGHDVARAAGDPAIPTAATRGVLAMRTMVIDLLHALLWVSAMFLADSIWGDRAAPWMVIGFALSGAILVVARRRTWRAIGES